MWRSEGNLISGICCPTCSFTEAHLLYLEPPYGAMVECGGCGSEWIEGL